MLILMTLLLLATAFLHFDDLDSTPPGLNYDFAYTLAHSLRISQGEPLPALIFDDRPEPLHRYLMAGWFWLVGAGEFTALVFHGLAGLLTVALAYRAGRELGGYGCGLVAAGTVAAAMPHLFLSRSAYRAHLLPPLLFAAILAVWSARRYISSNVMPHMRNDSISPSRPLPPTPLQWRRGVLRSGTGVRWKSDLMYHDLAAGIFTGLALNVYFAGMVAPVWMLGVLLHGWLFVPRRERFAWHELVAAGIGFAPLLALWVFTMTFISNLAFRVEGAAARTDAPLLERLAAGMPEAFTAYYRDAFHWMTLYIVPESPFLNPVLALLAGIGVLVAVWRWRHTDGAVLLTGLLGFTVPGALSELPTHPVRLIGALPFLALLAGWGAVAMLGAVYRLAGRWGLERGFRGEVSFVTLLVAASLFFTHTRYHDFFDGTHRMTPPDDWRNIPHNYSMPLVEAMERLAAVESPTYVPVYSLDDRIAALVLQARAFPHVITWPRAELTELPAGQVFYPAYDYLFFETPDMYPFQALLLPDDDTIVLLPASAGPIVKNTPGETQEITSDYGWTVAYITPRDAAALPPVPAPNPSVPIVGDGMRLLTPRFVAQAEPGGVVTLPLEWHVTREFGRDVFTFVQLLDSERRLIASDDRQILPFLYPSVRWQPGDIIPDMHTIQLPPELPQDYYDWTVGAWVSPPRQVRLDVTTPDGVYLDDRLFFGVGRQSLTVDAPLPENAQPLDVQLGEGIALAGYALNRESDTLNLTLYWRSTALTPFDYTVFVHIMDGEQIVAQADARPPLPTRAWAVGELVPVIYTLQLPEGVEPSAIYAGMYRYPSLERLPVMQDGQPVEDRRALVSTNISQH